MCNSLSPYFLDDFKQAAVAGSARGDLSGQVAFALFWGAHVREDDGHDVAIQFSASKQVHRGKS